MKNITTPISVELVFKTNTHKTAIEIQTKLYDTIASMYKDSTLNFTVNKLPSGTCFLICHIDIPSVAKSESDVFTTLTSTICDYDPPVAFNYRRTEHYSTIKRHQGIMANNPDWINTYNGNVFYTPNMSPHYPTPLWQQDCFNPNIPPRRCALN